MSKKDDALDEIANYILPFKTIDGEKYVRLELVEYLRTVAKKALAKK